MKHRKLRIAWSVVWGIVLLVTTLFWIRGYWRSDTLVRISPKQLINVASTDGVLYLYYDSKLSFAGTPPSDPTWSYMAGQPLQPSIENLFVPNRIRTSIPCWLLSMLIVSLGAASWLHWRFSLRGLLIVATVISLDTGLAIYVFRR